jgi:CheY-like chemotaxis protein
MTAGGRLAIETNRAEAPREGRLSSFVILSVSYSAGEPDLEHLFDPEGAGEDALALAVAHSIVTEHGGYLLACATAEGTRLDLFLPRVHEELAASEAAHSPEAPSILLIDYRDRVRAQLHKFFEEAGYNVIEAADREEAAALAQIHEGGIDLLIAEAPICAALPELKSLAIVDDAETSPHQIRRPFTQKMLLDRVGSLITRAVTSSA